MATDAPVMEEKEEEEEKRGDSVTEVRGETNNAEMEADEYSGADGAAGTGEEEIVNESKASENDHGAPTAAVVAEDGEGGGAGYKRPRAATDDKDEAKDATEGRDTPQATKEQADKDKPRPKLTFDVCNMTYNQYCEKHFEIEIARAGMPLPGMPGIPGPAGPMWGGRSVGRGVGYGGRGRGYGGRF